MSQPTKTAPFFRRLSKVIFYVILCCAFLNAVWVCEKLKSARSYAAKYASAVPTGLDAGFVLYGAESTRIHTAVLAYDERVIKNVVVIGGCRPQHYYFGAEAWAAEVVANGVPLEAVHVGTGSYDTYTNIDSIERMIAEKEWDSVALISDALHLKRVSGAMSIQKDSLALRQAYPIISDYNGAVFTPLIRAQYEVVVSFLILVTPKTIFNNAVKRHRLGRDAPEHIQCDPAN